MLPTTRKIFYVASLFFIISSNVYAQCPNFGLTESYSKNACFGVNDGVASVKLVGGGAGSYTASNFSLWLRIGFAYTPISATVQIFNGDSIVYSGLTPAEELVPFSSYVIRFTDTSCAGGFVWDVYDNPLQRNTEIFANATSTGVCSVSDGEILVAPSGGTSPYSLTWSGGPTAIPDDETNPTGLLSGSYDLVIMDAFGCTTSTTVVVSPAPDATLSLSGSNAICLNTLSVLQVTVTNGVGPFTVVIDTTGSGSNRTIVGYSSGDNISIAPTSSNTYTLVSLMDNNGCSGTVNGSVNITVNPLPPDATNPVDNSFCAGSPLAAISVDDPGAGFRIDWYDASTGGTLAGTGVSFNPSAAGTYWAEVVNETTLCISANRISATLTSTPPPSDATNPVDNSFCAGSPLAAISVDDPGAGFRIDWYDASTAGTLVGTGISFTAASAGTYWAEVVNETTLCISANRISATLTSTPPASDATNPVDNSYCAGSPLTVISVDDPGAGFRIDWYDASTAGTLVGTGISFTAASAGTYWAEVVNETTLCISGNRVSATLTEAPLPSDATNPVDNSFCAGSPLAGISVDDPGAGFRIDWYDASTAGTLVGTGISFTAASAGTYWAEVVNETTSCISANRISATLTSTPPPSDATNPVDNSFCAGSPLAAISVADPGAGFRIDWYDASTAGTLVGTGMSFTAASAGTYWAEVVNETTLCISANRISATLTSTPPPSDATNPVDNSFCAGSPLAAISVDDPGAGFRIDWYDASTAGTLVGTGISFIAASAGTYWAEVVNETTLCISGNRVSATLTEAPLPTDATNPVDNSYCVGSPLAGISVDDPGAGFRIDWYDASTGGTLAGTGVSFNPSAAGTYWAEVVNETTLCISANRISATLTSTPPPSDATNPVDNSFCAGSPLAAISVDDPGAGFRIDWYDASTAGTLVGTGISFTAASAGTYWAEVVNETTLCISANRISATLTSTPPASDATNPVDNSYCAGSPLTVISVDDPGAGFRIDWYDASTAGTLVGTGISFTAASAGTYWAEVVNETTLCISGNRVSATLTEAPLPSDATNPVDNSFCAGSPLAGISVDDPGAGFRIDWYDASTAGTLVGTGISFTAASAGTYWAEVVNETTLCISENRVSATLTEAPLPPDATNPVDNSFCAGSPLAAISVDDPGAGFRIDWYDASTAGTLVGTGMSLTAASAGTYWAEVVNETTLCISANRISATLTSTPPPSDATNSVDNSYCVGSPLTAISVDDPGAGFRIDWYDASTAGTLVGTGISFIAASAGTYWAEVVNETTLCISGNRVSATLSEVSPPSDAANPVDNSYCAGSPLTAISVDDPGAGFRIDWYDASTAGTLVGTGISFIAASAGTYWAEVVNETTLCISGNRVSATLTEAPLPADATNPVDNSFCLGSPSAAISVDDPGAGFRIDWYDASTAGTLVGTGISFTAASAGTYWAEVVNETTLCISGNRVSATLTEAPLPSDATNPVDNSFCAGSPLAAISVDDPGAGFRIDWYDASTAGTLVGTGISFTAASAGTYWAEVVNETTLCISENRVSATLIEAPLPSDATNPIDNTYCTGNSFTAISVDDPGAGFRIDWYDASTGGTLAGTGVSFNPSSAGSYWAEVVNETTLCISANRVSATLSEVSPPSDAANPVDNSYCAGSPFTAISVDDPGAGLRIDWYSASAGGSFTASGSSFIPAAAGTYWAEVVNQSTSCISANRVSVILTENSKPAPVTISGSSNPICQAAGEVFSVPNVAGSTYTWDVPINASITGPINQSSIIVDFGLNSGTITVVERSSAGCDGDISTLNISLQSCPFTADFISDVDKICVGGTVRFTDISSVPLGTTYTWDFGLGAAPSTASTEGPHDITYSSPGVKQITLEVNNGTLTNSISKFITVTDIPTATLSGDTTICPGSTTPLQVILTGTAPWVLVFSDSTASYSENIGASPHAISVTTNERTNYYPISITDSLCSGDVFGAALIDMKIPEEVTISLDSISGTAGSTVKVPIRTIGYENLMTMQFTIAWDANLLDFNTINDITLGNVTSSSFGTNETDNGFLTFSWNTASLSDTTISDSTAIFSIEFDLANTICSDVFVTVDDSPTALTTIEIADEDFCLANVGVKRGNVANQLVPQIVSSDGDNSICYGDQVLFTGVPGGMANYQFYLNGVEVQNGTNNVFVIDTLMHQDSVNVIIDDAFSCSLSAQGVVTAVEQITISPMVSDITSCGLADGAIALTVTGGSGTYTYNWTGPGIVDPSLKDQTDLAWGMYSVIVTDDVSGCFELLDVIISEPANFTLTTSKTDVTTTGGNDGAIDLTISSGTGPFSVTWTGPNGFISSDEDINSLFAGNYIAQVTDLGEGCTIAVSVDILQPINAIVLNATKTDVSTCDAMDGTINLLINGGSGSFTISWIGPDSFVANDQNLNGLKGGLYIATVVDLATTLTAQWSVEVNEPDGFSVSTMVTDLTYCDSSDGTITVDLVGGSADFDFAWKDLSGLGFTSTDKDLADLALGIYRLTVTDNNSGCIDSLDVTIARPSICDLPCALNVESTTNNTSCPDTNDGVAVINIISGGSASGNYFVSLDTGNVYESFKGVDITSFTDKSQGSYMYIVKDSVTGCKDTTFANVGISTNLMANIALDNPDCEEDNGVITFNVSGGVVPFEVDLIDAQGAIISMDGSGFFQFTGLAEGNYFYTITEQSGCTIVASDSVELVPDCSNICNSLVASAHSFEDASCTSDPFGKAVFDVTGGTSPYEYSIDGSTWVPFISGNVIENLPANGTYNVVIRQDSINPNCNVAVSVTIISPAEIRFETPITTTKNGSCHQNDGAVKMGRVSGGSPAYNYQIDGVPILLPSDSIVNGLSAGAHVCTVIDATNCQASFDFNVQSEGQLKATISDVPVSCTSIFLKAGIRVEIDLDSTTQPGPYQVYVASVDDPENGNNYQVPDNGVRTILELDKDDYVVNVSSLADGGCSVTEIVQVFGGATPVDFEIIASDSTVSCIGDLGSITVGNVIGDPDSIFTVQLFNQSDILLETYLLSLLEFEGGFTIDESNTDKLVAGRYYIKIGQHQQECDLVEATSKLISISEPTDLLALDVLEDEVSLSDKPTGSALGEVIPSGGDPYEALIQLIEPTFDMNINEIIEFNESRNWVEATNTGDNLNRDLVSFDSLWAGLYEIIVVDSYGCEFVLEHTIGYDEAVFIPNVFTPNDDGFNDFFYIRNLPDAGTKVVISSRSGSVVFESDDYTYDNLWDGGDVADGIYFYNIILPDGKIFKGWVEKWRGSRP